MNYLLTYEDASEIVKEHNGNHFFKTDYKIDDYKITCFTYFICDDKNFAKPLKNNNVVNGYDMRGTTFIFNKDKSLYKRFFMLPKFFNINQIEDTQYLNIKNKKIISITEKEDGSLISFMNLPNGKVFAKTIGGFSNEQVVGATKLYNSDKYLYNFINEALKNDMTPLFEYVALTNRIVLIYGDPELKFIGFRNNKNGKFIPSSLVDKEKILNIKTPKTIKNKSLNDLLNLAKNSENKEGWVIVFDDGQMIKIKTDWYFKIHNIRTEQIFREDYIIKYYLQETLDDVLQNIDREKNTDVFIFIDKVKCAVNNKITDIDKNCDIFFNKYHTHYNENWVKFATENHSNQYFGIISNVITKKKDYKKVKVNYIINNYSKKLKLARDFVEKWYDK